MKIASITLVLVISLATACQSSSGALDVANIAPTSQISPTTTSAISTSNPTPSQLALLEPPTPVSPPIQQAAPQLAPQASTPIIEETPQLNGEIEPAAVQPTAPRTRKTYLINGLASAVPFIGFGMRNLKKKMPGAKIYSYLTPVEGSIAVAPAVLNDIAKAHKIDPNVEVNLIGISYGANLIMQIASRLKKKGIRVNYLGIIEGTTLARIPSNVDVADNFTCTYLDCTRAKAKLASGNTTTRLESFKFNSSHIPLGNNKKMHDRIIRQVSGQPV